MQYIFYSHSNICSIVIYNKITQLLDENKSVTLLLCRDTKWNFNTPGLKIIDISDFMRKTIFVRKRVRTFKQIREAKNAYKVCDDYADRIINNEKFELYIPIVGPFIYSFLKSKRLTHYYFIEEGTDSYLDIPNLKKTSNYRPLFKLLSKVLGIRYFFLLYTNNKFRGTLGLSENSFPWNHRNKEIVNFNRNIKINQFSGKFNILILSYLELSDIHTLKETILYMKDALTEYSSLPIAIKFHPRSFSIERSMYDLMYSFIKKNTDFIVFESDYVVEYNVLQYKSNIYCLLNKSSIAIYSKMFSADTFLVENINHSINITQL